MHVLVSMTIENIKRRFFDINANSGRSATARYQYFYPTKTTITIIYLYYTIKACMQSTSSPGISWVRRVTRDEDQIS